MSRGAKGPAARGGVGARAGAALASFADDVGIAASALAGHPLRAALTLLGIVIGVFTVVSMMALTTGLKKAIDAGIGQLGANVFQIQRWPAVNFGPLSPEILKRRKITLPQALHLRELLPQAKQVGAEVFDFGKELSTSQTSAQGIQVLGGTTEVFSSNSITIGQGRGFGEGEALSPARVVVLGAGVVDSLFPGRSAVGSRIRLGRMELEVVGTLERQGGLPIGDNPDKMAVVPIGLFLELYGAGRSMGVTVMAHDDQDLKRLQDQAVAAFRVVRGLSSEQEDDFEIFSNDSIRATFDNLAGVVELFTLAVCALSLLVGGIGVMNIMLVAVAERTREIGLRKALGARRRRVLLQFVIEAVLLATAGGVLGVAAGYATAAIVRFGFNIPAAVPLWSVALALGVSSLIGLVFGIYPADRASRLDPAVALRNE
jgi:putative ABC transport system permease protein